MCLFSSCCDKPKPEAKEKKCSCHPCLKCIQLLITYVIIAFIVLSTIHGLAVVGYSFISPAPLDQDFETVYRAFAGLIGGLLTGAGGGRISPGTALPVKTIAILIDSFSSREPAYALRSELRRKRYYAQVVDFNNRFYVVIQGIRSFRLAQKYVRDLRRDGYRKASIIMETIS
ncbi:MAG: SPOR domain-containing protein [candidate division KSB1 bacterium]|nr:SPOR domain-containing protein [candidate division KSB1 bacterium]MDQ7066466.1 SPOR domain-containing protein [candidate division KSB1 bacterium]